MPPKKTIKETENTVKQGLTNKNCYWINMKAYQMLPNNEIVLSAGGEEIEVETELVKAFCVRNKKTYQNRIITTQIEYNEVVNFGKHNGKSVQFIYDNDRQWLKWCRDNFKFNLTQEKLKQEITDILK